MELKPIFKNTEFGSLPVDWRVSPLHELNPFITSGSRGWAKFYSETGAAFIRITNMDRKTVYLDLADLKYVQLPLNHTEGQRTQLKTGDVLISITADIGISAYVNEKTAELPAFINQHIALVRFNSQELDSRFVSYFLASAPAQKRFLSGTDVGAKAGMSLQGVANTLVALPSYKEQKAIADTLVDIDALLVEQDKLITKKRDIKKGAMQELLTGKRRLPGFSGEWAEKTLGEIAHIKTGSRNNQDKVESGAYPFFVRSANVERINSYSYDCEAILIPGEGGIGSIFHYINGRFDVHQRVYAITQFDEMVFGKFIFYFMAEHFGIHAMQNSVKATVDSLRLPTFTNFLLRLPPSREEQDAIAEILSDLEDEIAVLEAQREKTAALKQGMMQQLLTGKIRLT